MEERLQKLISACGLASRRAAEGWIIAGRVTVNGEKAHLGDRADLDRDTVLVDGRPLTPGGGRTYLMLNKPRGYVTTLSDEKGRKTVSDLVAGCGARVWPVGRLDMDSEGLLILTDDGDFAHRMLAPKKHVAKWYEARLDLPVTPQDADAFARGLELEGLHCLPALLQALPPCGDGTPRARVAVREGKFHQVKRMFLSVGKQVLYLKRIKIGLLELDPALCPGKCRLLQESELETIFLPDPLAEPRRP